MKITNEYLNIISDLYEKYKDLLYWEAYKILGSKQLSEEIVQETFVKLIENISAIVGRTPVETKNFLCVISRNLAINLYNKKNKEKLLNIDEIIYNEAEGKNNFFEIVIDNENVLTIRQAVKELPSIYRDVLILEKIYGYSVIEISRLLNLTEANVRKRSQRARTILLKAIERSQNANGEKL